MCGKGLQVSAAENWMSFELFVSELSRYGGDKVLDHIRADRMLS